MGDVARPFRPIAPRTAPPGGGGGGGHLPPGGGGPPEDGRMKRASTACKECQKRRTRCAGVPCSECQAHGRECIFDELSDRRRKASAKRTQEELDSLRSFVEHLLGVFRDQDGSAVNQLVGLIRSGANQDEIHNAVMHLRAQSSSASHHDTMGHSMINDHHMNNFFDPR